MITADQIKHFILTDLPCEYIKVDGDDGQHFEAVIVSAEFDGKRTLQQHQLVYKALGGRMGGEIHALAMKTFTPDEWHKQTN
jgi:acid stress-induced BolA-like protein IbaG/YrbA